MHTEHQCKHMTSSLIIYRSSSPRTRADADGGGVDLAGHRAGQLHRQRGGAGRAHQAVLQRGRGVDGPGRLLHVLLWVRSGHKGNPVSRYVLLTGLWMYFGRPGQSTVLAAPLPRVSDSVLTREAITQPRRVNQLN